jgi:hypothetical protein
MPPALGHVKTSFDWIFSFPSIGRLQHCVKLCARVGQRVYLRYNQGIDLDAWTECDAEPLNDILPI